MDASWYYAVADRGPQTADRKSHRRLAGLLPVSGLLVAEQQLAAISRNKRQPCASAASEKRRTVLPIQNFRDLDAWNVAMETAAACYSLAAMLPQTERFGLGS
jgi:hypothetical protein